MGKGRWRPAWAEVDLAAVRHNAALLAGLAGPATLSAVVKADGYGHGSIDVARAAVDGGAGWLAVALVEEGVVLREAGITAPILLLSEPPADAMEEAVARNLVPTVYTEQGIRSVAAAAAAVAGTQVPVHLKIDTGMHRVGAEPAEAVFLADVIGAEASMALQGVWTHLAVADGTTDGDRRFTDEQLDRFDASLAELAAAGHRPALVHAANSAGTIAHPRARRDLVRCGLAVYGELPDPSHRAVLAEATDGGRLQPALSLKAKVTYLRDLEEGERPSYGRRRPLPERSVVATAPIGYADGVPRRLFECGGQVLVGGIRRPLAGVVTMDQIVIDCGPPGPMAPAIGDEVVLIGRQGDAAVSATEWADLLGTISYEILCGIGPRVPRVATNSLAGPTDPDTDPDTAPPPPSAPPAPSGRDRASAPTPGAGPR
ncbi:MAG TPA: alanine racemase [Acidimicrobiales bacterium]|nr:alanine racemase [Acidimicrobiales bacterium]